MLTNDHLGNFKLVSKLLFLINHSNLPTRQILLACNKKGFGKR